MSQPSKWQRVFNASFYAPRWATIPIYAGAFLFGAGIAFLMLKVAHHL